MISVSNKTVKERLYERPATNNPADKKSQEE